MCDGFNSSALESLYSEHARAITVTVTSDRMPTWYLSARVPTLSSEAGLAVNYAMREEAEFLTVVISGNWESGWFHGLHHALTEGYDGYSRLLIDARELGMPERVAERITAGESAARLWRDNVTAVAVLCNPEQITNHIKHAAMIGGANLRVFTQLTDARAWILEDGSAGVSERV